jgi:hypothetical protein
MRGSSLPLLLLALVVVALWWAAWRTFGGADPLNPYTYEELVAFARHESAFYVALLVAESLVTLALLGCAGERIGAFLVARREELLHKPNRTLAALATVGALLALAIAVGVVGLQLTNEDEKTYLFQAQLLQGGRLSIPVLPEAAAFQQPFVVDVAGHWSGQYFWAHPALLTLGSLLRLPWLISAAEVWITIWLSGLAARELTGDDRIGLVTAALVATSPMIVMTGGTLHSANLATVCAAATLWAAVRLDRRFSWSSAAVLGTAIGVASHNRPLDELAILLGIGLLVLAGRGGRLRQAMARFSPALIFLAPFLLLHPLLNHAVSGDYRHNGYWLFNEGHGWNTMGFGRGPFGTQHGVRAAAAKMFSILARCGLFLSGNPMLLLLLAAPLFGVRAAKRAWITIPAVIVTVYFVCYFFYASTPIAPTGPVYFVPLVPVFAFWLAASAIALHDRLGEARPWAVGGGMAVALLAGLLLFWPSELLEFGRMIDQGNQCTTLAGREGITRGLVFVRPKLRRSRSWYWWPPLPRPDFSDPVLFPRTRTLEKDAQVVRAYGRDRPAFLAVCGCAQNPGLVPYDPIAGTVNGQPITEGQKDVFYDWGYPHFPAGMLDWTDYAVSPDLQAYPTD